MNEAEQKSGRQPYELFVFARRHKIQVYRARDILAAHGRDREASDLAASELKVPPVDVQSLSDYCR